MKILALETTEATGSVAAAIDDNVLLELKLDAAQRSAQSLAPAMRALLEQVRWRPGDVGLVAVTVGPGSFTGLRVGVTAAKVFAYAVGAGVLGLDTLQVIANGLPAGIDAVSVAVDAQRGDVVAGPFRRGPDGHFEPAEPQRLVSIDAWLENVPPGSVVAGPILEKLISRLPQGVRPLDPKYWHPTAGNVARLAARRHAAGHRDDIWALLPRYSRPSAAEEKWDERKRT